jgi:hypothetical protein
MRAPARPDDPSLLSLLVAACRARAQDLGVAAGLLLVVLVAGLLGAWELVGAVRHLR